MRPPLRFLVLALSSAFLASGCASALEVPIETPLKSKLDVSKFRRVLVAGFVTDLAEEGIDLAPETARLHQNQLRSASKLQVIEPDRYSEFHLVPDANRPLNYEVYSLESVEGFADSSPEGQSFRPFFETHHSHREGNAFFTLSRHPRSITVTPAMRNAPLHGPP